MRNSSATLFVILLLPLSALAGELDYDYLEAGALQLDADHLGRETGYGLRGSVSIGEQWHVFGGYETTEFDLPVSSCPPALCLPPTWLSLDHETYRLGVGYRWSLGDSTDWIVRAAAERTEFGHFADNTWSVETGVRSQLAKGLQVNARVRYTGADQPQTLQDEPVSVLVGAEWELGKRWSLASELTLNDSANSVFVGPRFAF